MKILKKFISFALFFLCLFGMIGGVKTVVSAEEKEVLSDTDYTVYGATAELDPTQSYTDGGSSIKMDLTAAKAGIYFQSEEIQQFDVFDDVIVSLRLKLEGSGYDGLLRLYKAGGELIDYGFPAGKWNNVRFKTKVYEKDGVKNVLLSTDSGKGKTIRVSDFNIEEAPEETPLLGGVKLYQMEAKSQLMESYVLETKEGEIIVMDGGDLADADTLVKFLHSFTNEIDHWFVSHYHCDHVRALVTILEYHDIKIKNLYYDFPTTATIKELSGDADAYLSDALDDMIAKYPEKVENVITPKRGDEIKVGADVTVKVLNNAYMEKNNNYGNNTTVVYKVETPGEDILFLGDLGDRGDAYLEDDWFVAEAEVCTVIQLAHHGQNGTTDKFYEMIKEKKVCLYAAKQWIYDNDNGTGFNTATLTTLHTRDLVREWGVLTIYTQADGRLLIE